MTTKDLKIIQPNKVVKDFDKFWGDSDPDMSHDQIEDKDIYDCNDIQGLFFLYLDGEADFNTRRSIEKHVNQCNTCKEELSYTKEYDLALIELDWDSQDKQPEEFQVPEDKVLSQGKESTINLWRQADQMFKLNPDKAEELYRKIIHLDSRDHRAYFNLAVILKRKGASKEALHMLNNACQCCEQLSQCQEMQDAFSRVIILDSDSLIMDASTDQNLRRDGFFSSSSYTKPILDGRGEYSYLNKFYPDSTASISLDAGLGNKSSHLSDDNMYHVGDSLEQALCPGIVLNNRYRLGRQIGAGGFASVFKSTDLVMKSEVAIKLLNIKHLEQAYDLNQAVARFEREIQITASINHPNIARVYNSGQRISSIEGGSDAQMLRFEKYVGIPFMVMGLLDGVELRQVIKQEECLPIKEIVHLFIACLEGLELVHEKAIVHKDIKPRNLFLADRGRVSERLVLLDFGAAAMTTVPHERQTGVNQRMGTTRYMAPEYLKHSTVCSEGDVYQVALTLAETITGKFPFGERHEADEVIAIRKHIDQPRLPDKLAKHPLGAALFKALHENPKERYRSAKEFADALKLISLHDLDINIYEHENRDDSDVQMPATELLEVRGAVSSPTEELNTADVKALMVGSFDLKRATYPSKFRSRKTYSETKQTNVTDSALIQMKDIGGNFELKAAMLVMVALMVALIAATAYSYTKSKTKVIDINHRSRYGSKAVYVGGEVKNYAANEIKRATLSLRCNESSYGAGKAIHNAINIAKLKSLNKAHELARADSRFKVERAVEIANNKSMKTWRDKFGSRKAFMKESNRHRRSSLYVDGIKGTKVIISNKEGSMDVFVPKVVWLDPGQYLIGFYHDRLRRGHRVTINIPPNQKVTKSHFFKE